MLKICLSEGFGTFVMVLTGVGAIVFGGFSPATPAGLIGLGLAFGSSVAAMIYVIGPLSGAHINPAVTVGFFFAERFPAERLLPHIASQVAGGLFAAGLITLLACSTPEAAVQAALRHFGASGWRWGSAGFPWWAAFVAEFVAVFIYVTVFLAVRHERSRTPFDGIVLGITSAGLHFAFAPISGASLNPARSVGPALFAGVPALRQLWLYLAAPLLAGALAGLLARILPLFGSGQGVEDRH